MNHPEVPGRQTVIWFTLCQLPGSTINQLIGVVAGFGGTGT